MKLLKALVIFATAAVITACANQITVSSQKSATPHARPDPLLIATQTPDNFLDVGPGYIKYHYFARVLPYLIEQLAKEKITGTVLKLDKLALNPREQVDQKAKEIGAAYVLFLDVPQKRVTSGSAIIQHYQVKLRLYDTKTAAVVWSGNVDAVQDWGMQMDSYMKDVATKIVEAMKKDKVF